MARPLPALLAPALLILAALLALPAPAPAAGGDPARRLEAVERAIRELDRGLAREARRRRDLRRELRRAEEALAASARELAAAEAALAAGRRRLQRLRAERERLEAERAALRRALEELVRTAYRLHRQGLLPALLGGEDPLAAARALRYYGYLAGAAARRARALEERLARLAALDAEEARQLAALEEGRSRRLARHRELEEARRRRRELLRELERELAHHRRRLEGLRADRRRLEGLLRELERGPGGGAPAGRPFASRPFASLRGRLPLPARGEVVARFGAPRRGGRLRWRGLVIAAPAGSPVRAVAPGRVVFAEWLRGYGLLLIIDHGEGYMSLYGFNERLDKGVGDPVQAGEQVAAAGGPQGPLRPGLYFEIRHRGRPLDPLAWCRAGR